MCCNLLLPAGYYSRNFHIFLWIRSYSFICLYTCKCVGSFIVNKEVYIIAVVQY